ncbi:MAG: CoA transferase [Dehalococcoidia bacterium]|nr:MAG: CoA transferase [Dehalococcoidia bacterium]
MLRAGKLELPPGASVTVDGEDPVLGARFGIGEAAAVALAACGAAAADLWHQRTGVAQDVRVDVRAAAASLLGFAHLRVAGKPIARINESNPTVALYQCGDGRWIHLHGGFPKLRRGTLDVLGCGDDAASIASAVRSWSADALEDALAERGMCGAIARTADEWAAHPQGQALAGLPSVEVIKMGDGDPQPRPSADRPLGGVRVLDLTRVLAGPACGRALAEHGADVLRIASPNLPAIELFDIETGHGKRSAYVDLDDAGGPRTLRSLIAGADVFVDGFRHGALARRGFGAEDVVAMRPGIVHVAINCYGHSGPWRDRPGWEQLAQSATGIAMAQGAPGPPRLVPAAACDYTTGYLAAYGTMNALARRAREGGSWLVRASLCQTAMWIGRLGAGYDPSAATGVGDVSDLLMTTATPFGDVTHLRPAAQLASTPARWELPTVPLGTDEAVWAEG